MVHINTRKANGPHGFRSVTFLSAQLHTFASATEPESRAAVVTRAEEQQQPCVRLFFLLVSQRMTFIHIHPDSMDPWVGRKEGEGQDRGGGR